MNNAYRIDIYTKTFICYCIYMLFVNYKGDDHTFNVHICSRTGTVYSKTIFDSIDWLIMNY